MLFSPFLSVIPENGFIFILPLSIPNCTNIFTRLEQKGTTGKGTYYSINGDTVLYQKDGNVFFLSGGTYLPLPGIAKNRRRNASGI